MSKFEDRLLRARKLRDEYCEHLKSVEGSLELACSLHQTALEDYCNEKRDGHIVLNLDRLIGSWKAMAERLKAGIAELDEIILAWRVAWREKLAKEAEGA